MGPTPAYSEVQRDNAEIAEELRRIAHRIEQGAISDVSAAAKLELIVQKIDGRSGQ